MIDARFISMVNLRSKGETFEAIADRYGVSKTQAIRLLKDEGISTPDSAKRWLKKNGSIAEAAALEVIEAADTPDDTTPINEANAGSCFKIARASRERAKAAQESLKLLEMRKELIPVETFNGFVAETMRCANNAADALSRLHGEPVRKIVLDHFASLDSWLEQNA